MTAHILIVGGGINGLATAWTLTRRGYRVSLFDQGPIPNPVSSSFDEHRITRHAYGPMRAYAQRMPQAFSLWDQLFADIGARHVEEMPIIAFEREDTGWIGPSLEDMNGMGVAWRELDPAQFGAEHPLIRSDGVTRAVELSGSGMLFPSRIVTDLVVHLAARGVRVHPHTKVEDIDLETGRVTAGGTVHAGDHVIIAAGAWVNRLLPGTTGELVPSRQTVLFLAPPPELASLWSSAPIYLDLDAETGTYVLPPRPGTRLKIGDHRFSRTGYPDASRLAAEEEVADLIAAGHLAFTDFDRYTVLERKACYYTVTEDEHFVIRSAGRKATLLSACSGHGFKLAPQSAAEAVELVEMGL
ncbi:NAD(P)/FAD-dependent oxidoreductase [Rhizobium sp. C4]|uniref:NAD(P)/FAD-dependent oxidoreductase n=1 Tax=Rhizobium sp. C4 TaxID=1349800 RepID=UPI001E4AE292|nr:FAD-dependent oxidoreductase [Rhizobium sp. C4]MCD2175617.1 FAD-dependent oxidoreductase [Rhizobium sp. C4]